MKILIIWNGTLISIYIALGSQKVTQETATLENQPSSNPTF